MEELVQILAAVRPLLGETPEHAAARLADQRPVGVPEDQGDRPVAGVVVLVLRGWPDGQPAQLLSWLARPEVRDTLEKAFFDAGSAPIAAELSTAVDQLARLTAAGPEASPGAG